VSFVVTLVFVSAAVKRWVWPVAYDLQRGEGAPPAPEEKRT
jgi:hypothetical protein